MSDTKEEKKTSRSRKKKLEPGDRRKQYLSCIFKAMSGGKSSVPVDVVKIIGEYSNHFLHDSIVKRDHLLDLDIECYRNFIQYAKPFPGSRIPRHQYSDHHSDSAESRYYYNEKNVTLCYNHWLSFVLALDRNRVKRARRLSYTCKRKNDCIPDYGGAHTKCEQDGCRVICSASSDYYKECRRGNYERIYCRKHASMNNSNREDNYNHPHDLVVWHKHKLYNQNQ
jgi:hypothetical protein